MTWFMALPTKHLKEYCHFLVHAESDVCFPPTISKTSYIVKFELPEGTLVYFSLWTCKLGTLDFMLPICSTQDGMHVGHSMVSLKN